ncbi:MAG: MBL fold metallo-hydrolase [Gemmatimonadaceae bacterium]
MRIWLLGSGSNGNAIVVEHGKARILIDAGFGPRTLCRRLARARIAPQSILALMLTHEHIDHVRGARGMTRRFGWPVYATRGTHSALPGLAQSTRAIIDTATPAVVDGMLIEAWRISHDATEPVAFFVTALDTGERALIAYDLGYVSSGLAEACGHADILVVESNHDEGMLRAGPYPPRVQARIAGPRGHLSNRAAAVLMRAAIRGRARHVVLAHLSEINNSPDVALGNARRALAAGGFSGTLLAAVQDTVSGPVGSTPLG